MGKGFQRRLNKIGQPPGYIYADHPKTPLNDKISLSILEYDENKVTEQKNVSVKQCLERLNSSTMTWITVHSVSDVATLAYLGEQFKIHPLALEDIMNTGHRPKLDTYDTQVFIITRFLTYNSDQRILTDEQVSIVFGPGYTICFLESDRNIFKPIKDRICKVNSRFRKQGSDYLAYALIDLIVDCYLAILEQIDQDLDELEEELMRDPNASTLQKIRLAKRQMIVLRKSVWPMRDVVSRFQQLENHLVGPTTQIYLKDVYDHTVHTIDIIESFRDIVSGMIDVYLSNINIRMNEIVKVLTIVSTIFVPLTFVTGVYGMNFDHMPELHYYWSYPIVLMMMTIMALSMVYIFYKKKWI